MVFTSLVCLENSHLNMEPNADQSSVKRNPMDASSNANPSRGSGRPMVKGEDIRLHRHDTVNIDLGVHKLQQEARKESIPGVVFLDCAGTAEGPHAR